MSRAIDSANQFTIIGENIHTTRIVLRNGRRATTLEDGTEVITFKGVDGGPRHLTVPEHFRETQAYEQGQLKHFMIAVWKGVHGDAEERAEGAAYIEYEARRQIRAGAHFLDLNVDEVSHVVEEQKRSMRWLVQTVQEVAAVPPSVDSSLPDVIAEGLAAYDGALGRPLLNSVALERVDVLDLVKQHDTRVVATAAGEQGMPNDAKERVANVGQLLEAVLSRGISHDDVYLDALVFPISVSGEFGRHYLDAVKTIRDEFGREIHVTGGLSNVSFGLPKRRLINEAFLYLALEHGVDSGIIDPIQTKVKRALELDTESEPVKLAMSMLMGEDEFCVNFLGAYRAGKLD